MASPPIVPIFDGHNDVLLRLHTRVGADAAAAFLQGEGKGQLDLPMARAGGFAGGFFALFVPGRGRRGNGEGTPGDVMNPEPAPMVEAVEAQRTVFAMLSLLLRIERASAGQVAICRSVGDIARALEGGVLAPIVHIEGAEAIDADLTLLEVLHAAGLRSLGPVWSRSNIFGHGVPFRCPSSPDIGPGLTDIGKELVRACNRLRVLVDLSHLNEAGFWDVAAITDAPLVATHSNAHALSPHSRNLTDRQLAAIAESDGMVGVNFATSFLRGDGKMTSDTPIGLVVDHVAYLVERLGEDRVGFGSDFDGARIPGELANAGGLQKLVALMRERGFGQAVIEKLCWRNWLRVLGATWLQEDPVRQG